MSSNWPLRTIAECASNEPYATQIGPFGKALTPEDYRPSGVPLLRGVNVNHGRFHDDDFVFIGDDDADRLSKFESFPNDVLLVHKGTLGQIGLMPTKRRFARYIMGNSMLRVRCDPNKLLPEFLYYWLCSPGGQHYLFSHISQVGVPQIQRPLSTLRAAQLPVPAITEQRAIVDMLGVLDDKIESNHRASQMLERISRAIFRAWFVDFEPVKTKAAGARSFPGMPQEVFDVLPSRLVESAFGPAPQGWMVIPLDEAMEVNPARRLARGVLAPYLDMGQMPTEGHAPMSWVEREAGSGARFMNGDTLVARITPCLENGKTAFVDFLSEGQIAWGSTEYIVLRPKPPIPDLYAYLLARTPEFRAFAIQNMTGSSGRQRVPFNIMNKFDVVVGPISVMKAFGAAVGPLFSRSSASFRETRLLAMLRDYLLPKLMNGEIRVRER